MKTEQTEEQAVEFLGPHERDKVAIGDGEVQGCVDFYKLDQSWILPPSNPETYSGKLMRRVVQIVCLLSIVLAALCFGCARRDKDYVEDTDPEMADAIAKAQKALPRFWEAFDTRSRDESNFVLVVRITDKGRIEHFFTGEFERRDGKTIVTITNSPKIVSTVKAGDRLEIPPADITDWNYMREGKHVGMFTMKPRFKHMPPGQVEAIKGAVIDP